MTRSWFGASGSDVTTAVGFAGSLLARSHAVTFWDAQTGGTKYEDLLLNAAAVSSVTSGPDGLIPRFQGPDGVIEMWADAGGGGSRVLIRAQRRIFTVPAGTTGYADQPDGTLWLEYS